MKAAKYQAWWPRLRVYSQLTGSTVLRVVCRPSGLPRPLGLHFPKPPCGFPTTLLPSLAQWESSFTYTVWSHHSLLCSSLVIPLSPQSQTWFCPQDPSPGLSLLAASSPNCSSLPRNLLQARHLAVCCPPLRTARGPPGRKQGPGYRHLWTGVLGAVTLQVSRWTVISKLPPPL